MTSPTDDSAPTTQEKNMKRGMAVMKVVVRAKSQGIKFELGWNNKGQPINPNKSKFVSYIGVVTRKTVPIIYDNWRDVPVKFKDNIWDDLQSAFDIDESRRKFVLKEAGRLLRHFRTSLTRCVRDADGNINEHPPEMYTNIISEDDWKDFVAKRVDDSFQKLSDKNRQRATNHAYPYRKSRIGYACLEQKMLEEAGSEVTSIPRHLLWKSARVNKMGVIDRENVQQVWDHCETLSQRKIQDCDILGRALNLPEYPGRVRGLGFGVSKKNYFPPQKRSKQQDERELQHLRDMVESLQHQVNNLMQKVDRQTNFSSHNTKESCTLASAHLSECLEGFGDEDTTKTPWEAGEKGASRQETEGSAEECQPQKDASTQDTEGSAEECQPQKDAKDCWSEDKEKMEHSLAFGLLKLKEKETVEVENEEDKDNGRDLVLSEILIKKAIRKRASYIRANTETLTMAGLRRLLEEDLELDKFTLDSHKKFISEQLDEVLNYSEVSELPKNAKKIVEKKPHTKAIKKVSCEGKSDTSDKESVEEYEVEPRKKMVPKVKMQNSTNTKKRKGSTGEINLSSKKRVKLAKAASEYNNDAEVNRKNTEDNQLHSSQEKSTKKKEVSTPLYGKQVEHLKFKIKACGTSGPPIYKVVKLVPINKPESQRIKGLKEIQSRVGLSSNPSEKEIKEGRRKTERAKELQGIDVSNIVSSSSRRSMTSFASPPKPRIPIEINSSSAEHSDDDIDDEDNENEEDGSDAEHGDTDDDIDDEDNENEEDEDEEEDNSDHDGSQSDEFNEDEEDFSDGSQGGCGY